jgi:ferredoxin-NADP reductase
MAIRGGSSVSRVTDQKLRWQQARIVAITPLTRRIKSFVFAPSEPFAFRAGQHVDVRLTAPDGYRTERSYSIGSAPEDGGQKFELAIERLEDGEVSPFFHDVAEVSDDIELRGPIGGHFIWSVGDGGPVLLLGGGSGVVPLMSMLRHRAAEGARTAMALLYSARTEDELIYRDELVGMDRPEDSFALAFAVTRESARRARDYSRRIDAPMVSEVIGRLPEAPRRTYVCGSNRFVEAATEAAIAAGVGTNTIRTERYGG